VAAIVIVTIVAAVISALCSIMEAALYSIPPSKIEELRAAGDKGGERLHRLRENVDQPIAAILTLNTIANTVGAALAGGLVAAAYGSTWSGVYGGIFTLIILFFAEIIPKTLGVTYSHKLAPLFSGPMSGLIIVLYPFIAASQVITSSLRRGNTSPAAPSEKELLALTEMGAREGTLLPDEARWAVNALRLNDVEARDLMTPRTVTYMLPVDLTLADISRHREHWSFSRLPVVRNNDPDRVEGIIHRREVFDALVDLPDEEKAIKTLRDFMHPATFVHDRIRCNELIRMFLENRQHLLVVTNEYGGMEGVISLEDVLEFILGEEIVDPHDKHEDMQEEARRIAQRRLRRTAAMQRAEAVRVAKGTQSAPDPREKA